MLFCWSLCRQPNANFFKSSNKGAGRKTLIALFVLAASNGVLLIATNETVIGNINVRTIDWCYALQRRRRYHMDYRDKSAKSLRILYSLPVNLITNTQHLVSYFNVVGWALKMVPASSRNTTQRRFKPNRSWLFCLSIPCSNTALISLEFECSEHW